MLEFYKNAIDKAWESTSTVKSGDKIIPCRDILIFCHGATTIAAVADIVMKAIGNSYPCIHAVNGLMMNTLSEWRRKFDSKKRILISLRLYQMRL